MILAGIDIGTNSLRLLIADITSRKFTVLHTDRRTTRLGQDLDRTGAIAQTALDRTLAALDEFAGAIRGSGAVAAAAVGTSALRRASNAADLISQARARAGIEVRVITGEEEAMLTAKGTVHALSNRTHDAAGAVPSWLIFDVGGGSTEILFAEGDRITGWTSLPLGAVYFTERFISSDPPHQEQAQRLKNEVRSILAHECNDLRPSGPCTCAGTAGTVTTLASMDLKLTEYDPDAVTGHRMDRARINDMVRMLGSTTLAGKRSLPGLERGREDIIFAGAVIVQEVMDFFGCSSLLACDWGLREGIVLDLYAKLQERGSSR